MHEWAMDHVAKRVKAEGNAATPDGFLRTEKKPMTSDFTLGFNLQSFAAQLQTFCPTFMRVLRAFCITSRQKRKMSVENSQRKINVCHHFPECLPKSVILSQTLDDHQYWSDPTCGTQPEE